MSLSLAHTSQSIPSHSITTSFQPSPSLLVKIRVCDSGESDFYEVELPSLTYEALLKYSAEELEVDVSQISKIRKLPNVLLRRDRDVQRLAEGQELEVVLKEATPMVLNPLSVTGGFGSSSNGLSILNLSSLPGDPSSLTASTNKNSLGLLPTSHVNGLH